MTGCTMAATVILFVSALSMVSGTRHHCPSLMNFPNFTELVVHGIHSLTLPDIYHYFPTNNNDIKIPVVNPDLQSNQLILSRPPDYKHSFDSPGMRAADIVLSHMNSPNRDIALYSDLEKLVHSLHMQEMWHDASIHYKKLIESATDDKPSPELCSCIKDVENNGIIEELKKLADRLKGGQDGSTRYWWLSHWYKNWPYLKTIEDWKLWKSYFVKGKMPEARSHSSILAVFMYCTL